MPWELKHSCRFYPLSSSYLQAKLSISQREVKIQEGPLYRTEGYPVSISCNVSGHRGPSTQDFQWSIYLPSAPTQEVQIISTKDAGFSYTMYTRRVQSKEIYVERLRGNSVLLRFSKLQMKDTGEYECYTPNTDGKYFGSYSAKTYLTGELLLPSPWQACIHHHNACRGRDFPLVCLLWVQSLPTTLSILEMCHKYVSRVFPVTYEPPLTSW